MRGLLLSFLMVLLVSCLYAQDVEVDLGLIAENTAQYSPLLRAASTGDLAALQEELRAGHNVDEQNESGFAAVHAATRYGHNDALRMLIEAKANLNVQEADGWTPLMFASYNGNAEAVQLMLEANADPLISKTDGYAAHSIAYFNQFQELSAYIAEVGLRRSIQSGDIKAMLVMVADGANVNTQTPAGATALMVACHAGDRDLVSLLLSRPDIHPDFQENDGWTALMFAAYFDHPEIVHILLNHGVDLSVRNVHGQTALSLAQEFGRADVVRVIEERIAYINEIQAQQQQQEQQGQSKEAVQPVKTTDSTTTTGTTTATEGAIHTEKKPASKGWSLFG